MKYNQCYHYGRLSVGGFGIKSKSGGDDKDFSNFIGGQKNEFDNIATEYFMYNEKSKCFGYLSVIDISKENTDSRYQDLKQVFIPQSDEKFDFNKPESYIKYMYHYYYRNDKVNFYDNILLEQIETTDNADISITYKELLEKFHFSGEQGTKKLAKLLEIQYNALFYDSCRKIVIPVDDKYFGYNNVDQYGNVYRISAEICLLMHLLIPDCLSGYLSAENLHKNLVYGVFNDTQSKTCICFVPQDSYKKSSDEKIYDLQESYNDFPKDSIYYILAEKAQISKEEMQNYLKGICSQNSPENFYCTQWNIRSSVLEKLIEIYNIEKDTQRLSLSEEFISWEKSKISDRLSNANKGLETAKEYCKEYLNHIIKFQRADKNKLKNEISDEQFSILWEWALNCEEISDDDIVNLFDCIDGLYGIEIKKLKDLREKTEVLKKLYSRKENNIISEHIELISQNKNVKQDLESCIDCYKNLILSDSDIGNSIKNDILEELKKSYNDCESIKEKFEIDIIVREKSSILNNIEEWDRFISESEVKNLNNADEIDNYLTNTALQTKTKKGQISPYISVIWNSVFNKLFQMTKESIESSNVDSIKKLLLQMERVNNLIEVSQEKKQKLADYKHNLKVLEENEKIVNSSDFDELQNKVEFSQIADNDVKAVYLNKINKFLDNCTISQFEKTINWTKENSKCEIYEYSKICEKIEEKVRQIKIQINNGDFEKIWWLYLYYKDDKKTFWETVKVKDFDLIYNYYESCANFDFKFEKKPLKEFLFKIFLWFKKNSINNINTDCILEDENDSTVLKDFIEYISNYNILNSITQKEKYFELCECYENSTNQYIYRDVYNWFNGNVNKLTEKNKSSKVAQKIETYGKVYEYIENKTIYLGKISDYSEAYSEGIFSENEKAEFEHNIFEELKKSYSGCYSIKEKSEIDILVRQNSNILNNIENWNTFICESELSSLNGAEEINNYITEATLQTQTKKGQISPYTDIVFNAVFNKISEIVQGSLKLGNIDDTEILLYQMERIDNLTELSQEKILKLKDYNHKLNILQENKKIISASNFDELENKVKFSHLTDYEVKAVWLNQVHKFLNDTFTTEDFEKIINWTKENSNCNINEYFYLCDKIESEINDIWQKVKENKFEGLYCLYVYNENLFWENIPIESFSYLYDIFEKSSKEFSFGKIKNKGLRGFLFVEFSYLNSLNNRAKKEIIYKPNLIGNDFGTVWKFIEYISEYISENILNSYECKSEYLLLCEWYEKYSKEYIHRCIYSLFKENSDRLVKDTNSEFARRIRIYKNVCIYIDENRFNVKDISDYVSAYIEEGILSDDDEREILKDTLFRDAEKYINSERPNEYADEVEIEMNKISMWNRKNRMSYNGIITALESGNWLDEKEYKNEIDTLIRIGKKLEKKYKNIDFQHNQDNTVNANDRLLKDIRSSEKKEKNETNSWKNQAVSQQNNGQKNKRERIIEEKTSYEEKKPIWAKIPRIKK